MLVMIRETGAGIGTCGNTGLALDASLHGADEPERIVLLNSIQAELSPSLRIVHIIGTNDLLYPGALRFDQACVQAGVDIETYVFDNMFHVFSLMPIPQARKSRKIVHEVLSSLCV